MGGYNNHTHNPNFTTTQPQPKTRRRTHLALGRHVLRGKHGRVRGGLVTVGLHLHAARHAGQRLAPRQVRHVLWEEDHGETGPGQSLTRVDSLPANARNTPINQPTNHACTYHEGVVEGREDVRHAEDVLALRGLGAEVQGLRVVDRLGSSPLGLMDCGFEGMGLDGDEICGLTGGWAQARPDPPTSSSGVIDLPHTYASVHPSIHRSIERPRTYHFDETTTEAAACARGMRGDRWQKV